MISWPLLFFTRLVHHRGYCWQRQRFIIQLSHFSLLGKQNGQIMPRNYMANPALGKSLCSDWFFLGQDFAVRTISMETVQPVYFSVEAKPANSKFATKTAKKETVNIAILHSETTRRGLKRLKFFRHFKDGWKRRRTFSKRVLLSWRSETGITECHITKTAY